MSEKWKYDAKEQHSALYTTLCKPRGVPVSGSGDRGTFVRVANFKKGSYFLLTFTV